MADQALVTIITPTYNRADLLPETIESVLAQDYPNIEYIVLDDGSKDNTVDILRTYTDARLRWDRHENMGETRTVNKGFGMATGEFIAVVNSDDPVLPGFIGTAVDYLQTHPEVLVAYPDWVMIDEKSQPVREIDVLEYPYHCMLQFHHCPIGPGGMFRRRALELAGGRDEHWRYVGDYEFWLRVGMHGRFARIPQKLVTWRTHSGGATTAEANTCMANEHINVVKAYYQRADVPAAAQAVKREALCNANYVAGLICLPQERHAARLFFLRSIFTMPFAPLQYPNMRRDWRDMLRIIFLPRRAHRAVSSLKQRIGV